MYTKFSKDCFCYDFFSYIALFVGYENAIGCLKSLVLTFALMDRRLSVEEAVHLSLLETEFQVKIVTISNHLHPSPVPFLARPSDPSTSLALLPP